MKPLRLLLALLLAVGAVALARPTPAYAGGPTSVLLTSPSAERVAALYYSDPRYAALTDAVGDGQDGPSEAPKGVNTDFSGEVRLTWLIHDMQIWRVDRIHTADDESIWIETVVDFDGKGSLFTRPAHWHRPADPAVLSKTLAATGLTTAGAATPAPEPAPSESATPAAATTPPAAPPVTQATAGPPAGLVGAALGGLVLGAAGALGAARLARRTRPVRAPRVTLTG